MPFSFSGQIAGGADQALEEVLDRRLKEQLRQDQERQRAADLILRQQGVDLQRETLEGAKADRAANLALQQKKFDLDELQKRDELAETQTNRNRASDMAGVLAMPGMKPEDQIREISGIGMRAGTVDPEKVIAGLRPVKPDVKTYTYTDPRSGKQSLRSYDPANMPEGGLDLGNEPPKPAGAASQGDRFWVNRKQADGSVKPVRVSDATYNPDTDEHFDPILQRGQEKTKIVHPQLVSYSENVIRKIDDLIGAKDDPKTPENEAKESRINKATAGIGGAILGSDYWPYNTKAKDVKGEMFSLASELAIDALQKMRASSATGGGVGNVALGEMEIMKNAQASITLNQSPDNLQRQLKIIRDSQQRFLEEVRRDAEEKRQRGEGITVAPGGAPPAGGKKKYTIIPE